MLFAVGIFNAIGLSGVIPLFYPMAYKEIGGESASVGTCLAKDGFFERY